LVNLAFAMVTQSLALVQGIIIPRLLGPGNMGLFAIAIGGVGIGKALKELGIPKKLVQEREIDLYTSYRVAFTLEVMLAATFLTIVLAIAPVLATIYHRPELWLLTSVMAFSIFTTAFLDLPAALPYREMRFVRRNIVQSLGPVATFIVTVPLAFLGFGIWALAIGSLCGFAVAAITVLFLGPIRPGFAWEGALVRRYVRYGWPLWASTVITLIADWGVVFVVSWTIGVAGLGFFELAEGWASRALTVDTLLSDAVFPALCSIQGSTDRLRRAFDVTNQLSMLFAATVGFGMGVFAGPVVALLLGPSWHPAVLLVQAQGLGIVLASIGFNWDTFLAARGETRPQLTVTLLAAGWVALIALPLIALFKIPGAAAALAVLACTAHLVRQRYLRRIFGPISLIAVVWKQIAGCGTAAAVVVALQMAGWTTHGLVDLVLHATVFLALCGLSALVTTRGPLLKILEAVKRDGGDDETPVALDPVHRPHSTHRQMAFPLALRADDAGGLWVTTRDWPALGRMEIATNEWRWIELPPFPHLPTPDGAGGCWTALTRASAVVHVDDNGEVTRRVALPKTRELLGSILTSDSFWVVDAWHRRLWRIPTGCGNPEPVQLPASMVRPDIVVEHLEGTLWVGDTRASVVAVVRPQDGSVHHVVAPHPTRWLLPDPESGGMWLCAPDRSQMTLVDATGRELNRIDPGGTPYGLARLPDDRIVVALKDQSAVAVVDTATGHVDQVPVAAGAEPMGVAVVGQRCFVTLAATSEIVELHDAVLTDRRDIVELGAR
jgi:O-antigen/teichoic acid export membrane protein/streptogramin lyase